MSRLFLSSVALNKYIFFKVDSRPKNVGLHTDRIETKFKFEENNNKSALLKHYANYHEEILVNKPCISDYFRVIFVEQPNKRYLDW